jgi:hypothetical protein
MKFIITERQHKLVEIRVPREERIELYRDNNLIIVIPLTHRALKKYAHRCQWCINNDIVEWQNYHQGLSCVIIQRNPQKIKVGVTDNATATEIFQLRMLSTESSTLEDINQMLQYNFETEEIAENYYDELISDFSNFATNIVYYGGQSDSMCFDMEDNLIQNFGYNINDVPNISPETIKIMDNYLESNRPEYDELYN